MNKLELKKSLIALGMEYVSKMDQFLKEKEKHLYRSRWLKHTPIFRAISKAMAYTEACDMEYKVEYLEDRLVFRVRYGFHQIVTNIQLDWALRSTQASIYQELTYQVRRLNAKRMEILEAEKEAGL